MSDFSVKKEEQKKHDFLLTQETNLIIYKDLINCLQNSLLALRTTYASIEDPFYRKENKKAQYDIQEKIEILEGQAMQVIRLKNSVKEYI